MESLAPFGIVAAIVAVIGVLLGRKSKGDPPPPPPSDATTEMKEVLTDHVKKTSKAGNDLAAALAADADKRVESILRNLRSRSDK